jgi:hypothetical protein
VLDVETLGGPTVVVSVEEQFSRGLRLDMAVNLYRIAQEAAANAARRDPSNARRQQQSFVWRGRRLRGTIP